jgi:malonate decarboxylase epsilon subunit
MSIALLFPGQGSQRPGMLQHLPSTPTAAKAWFQARRTLRSLTGVPATLDTREALESTTNAQLALLIAGVVSARALVDDEGLQVDFVAGHSIGAFAAAVVAGVLSLSDALRVVQVRGDEMQRACRDRDWGMAALGGLPLSSVRSLLNNVATNDDPLWLANINSADQIVISGTRAALDTLHQRAAAAGAREMNILDVSVASHCPLQADTARAVADALRRVAHGNQRRAYLTNTTGRRLLNAPEKVIDDLAQAVRQPVQWHDATRLMAELGVTIAIETPPGHVLTGIAARAIPDVQCFAADEIGIGATVRRARAAIDS